MRRYLLFSLLILLYLAGGAGASPSKALATDKSSTIAIVLLGPLEFQHRDYYEIVATTLDKKYGGEKNKLVVGDHPQYMFNRFSDKQGLPPGKFLLMINWLISPGLTRSIRLFSCYSQLQV